MPQIVVFNKPFRVLCQFTDNDDTGRATLADYISLPGVYPAGRLDFDSEGLLILTDDGKVQHHIAHPDQKQSKTYWVQVEGDIDPQALAQLAQGVALKDGPTLPTQVKKIAPPAVWERVPPIRERSNQPTSWISISLKEGRNRQVRRMTAAVGYPTLRLIRAQIGAWALENLQPGEYRTETIHLPAPTRKSSKKPAPARKGRSSHKSHQKPTTKPKPQGRRKP